MKTEIKIKNRWTSDPIYTGSHENFESAVLAAIASDADIIDMDLRGADLVRACLGDANLRCADLRGVDLRGACLRDARLRGADLRGADLRVASLRGADLRGADLRGACLIDMDLRGANLRDADLRGAELKNTDLLSADLSGAKGVPIPDPALPLLVAKTILASPKHLEMSTWHNRVECGTTHCLAGWAIHLTPRGSLLEEQVGPKTAGQLLLPSAAHLFMASNERAMDWCREMVAKETGIKSN